MDDLRHIVRLDIPDPHYPDRHGTQGWQVRIGRQGRRHTKFFADLKHGGTDEALEAAKTYRDSLLKVMPEPSSGIKESRTVRAHETGVPGLHITRRKRRDGETYPYLQVSWVEASGERGSSSYSLRKWGLERALWNAVSKLARHSPLADDPVVMYKTAFKHLEGELE